MGWKNEVLSADVGPGFLEMLATDEARLRPSASIAWEFLRGKSLLNLVTEQQVMPQLEIDYPRVGFETTGTVHFDNDDTRMWLILGAMERSCIPQAYFIVSIFQNIKLGNGGSLEFHLSLRPVSADLVDSANLEIRFIANDMAEPISYGFSWSKKLGTKSSNQDGVWLRNLGVDLRALFDFDQEMAVKIARNILSGKTVMTAPEEPTGVQMAIRKIKDLTA